MLDLDQDLVVNLELEQPVVGPLADELDPVAKAIELAAEEADFECHSQLEAVFSALEAALEVDLEAELEADFCADLEVGLWPHLEVEQLFFDFDCYQRSEADFDAEFSENLEADWQLGLVAIIAEMAAEELGSPCEVGSFDWQF